MGRLSLLKRIVALVVASSATTLEGAAQPLPREEQVTFTSLTMTDEQFLKGDKLAGVPVALIAKLQLPASTTEPIPAVILLHGSDGPGSAVTWNWAKVLNRMGIATMRIDSYSGRGFEEIFTDQGRLGEFNNIVDTFEAVSILARDPRIDSDRIAVMGFSRGGIAALYSAMTRFQELHGAERPKLAAHVAFYPPCNFALERELEVGAAPILVLHGEADTWNPIGPCRNYVERLRAKGYNAELAAYPKAHHAFDHPGSPSYNIKDDAQTSRSCKRQEQDGRLLNAATQQLFTWEDACVEMRPAVQFNSDAASAAERKVEALLGKVFSLN